MHTSEFSFQYRATGPGLTISLLLDGREILKESVSCELKSFSCNLPEDSGQHVLEIQMSGKTALHTVIDSQGKILSDTVLIIDQIKFDGVHLGQTFTEKSSYTHDFNGNGPVTVEKFYHDMGCNGVVRLEFFTPIYLWLLEIL